MKTIQKNPDFNCNFRRFKNQTPKPEWRAFCTFYLLSLLCWEGPSFPLLPLVGALAQGRAGPCSAWVLAPLLHWLGFSTTRITEVIVSENVSGDFFFLSISSFVYEKMPSLRTKISQNWWKVSLVLCPPHSKSLTSFKYVTLTIQSGLFSQKIVYVCLDRYSLTLVSLQLFCLWADVMYYYWKIVRFIKHQKSCVEWLFSGLKSFH